MKRRKKIIPWILAAAFAMVFVISAVALSIWQYGSVDEKRQADVIIVLGAGTDKGEVSPVYRERLNHGIWLYENGYAEALIVTGGTGEGNKVSDAYAAKQYAAENGVPEEHICIEESSTITEENFLYSKEIMEEKGFETAIVVSDPLHMKRAMLMANDYGIEGFSSPTPTTMYKTLKTQLPFLAREKFFYIGYSIVRIFR